MIVILHGWSDDYKSFKSLGKFLADQGLSDVTDLHLGNYISMDDDVTYDDIIAAMEKAWKKRGLPNDPRSVDVIVHSTGGLVIRDWMTRFRTPENNPIRRLLFLAPANFGSPLAHKGNAFIGRITKGFTGKKLFQTGRHILEGLELGSEYSWQLAWNDVFSDKAWYGPGKVLATVLVGNDGYSGIAAIANESGTDGTVRVSTANLNAEYFHWDFATDPSSPVHTSQLATAPTAFARLNDENHGTITMNGGHCANQRTADMMLRALQVEDGDFNQYCLDLQEFSENERQLTKQMSFDDRKFRAGYQNTVIHLSDDTGHDVEDYVIEFFAKKSGSNKPDNLLTALIQQKVITTVHPYGNNKSYRSILIDTDELQTLMVERNRDLFISLTALPELSRNGNVGYSTLAYNDIGSIHIEASRIPVLIQPDRTLLIDIVIKRQQGPKVFEFKSV